MKNNKYAPPVNSGKIKQSDHVMAVKIKTESNGLGALKTLAVVGLIVIQAVVLILSFIYFLTPFQWYFVLSLVLTLISCIHVLSSDFHGQAKATWVLFLLVCFSFGFFIYLISNKQVLFAKSKQKYSKIFSNSQKILPQSDLAELTSQDKAICNYLYNTGGFRANINNSKTTYYSSGYQFYDAVLDEIKKAKKFIFFEFFIISDGVLLNRLLKVLKQKASEGVDVRIIYDDMGSHSTLSEKTKKQISSSGIKLLAFNRLVPLFNIALNLRNHRKIVVVDGLVSFTGGTNLADEYVNEKRMHGYWKDTGIKIEGPATDNLTLSVLHQWEFLTGKTQDYSQFLNLAKPVKIAGTVVPFVSGPNYDFSIAQNMYANQIGNSHEKLWIMTPYFIPDETIMNLIINRARAGVDVRIVLPEVADKKFVYFVSRNNAEKLIKYGVKVYTMTHSFVHAKVVLNETSAIVGSINFDLRSFNQQFESAVFTTEEQTRKSVALDFENTFERSIEVIDKNKKRNSVLYRIIAGTFNIISPFM